MSEMKTLLYLRACQPLWHVSWLIFHRIEFHFFLSSRFGTAVVVRLFCSLADAQDETVSSNHAPGFIQAFLIMNTYDVYLYLDGRTQIIKIRASSGLEAKAIAETRLGIAERGFDQDRRVFAVSERQDRDTCREE
jgi:hypothetical protein